MDDMLPNNYYFVFRLISISTLSGVEESALRALKQNKNIIKGKQIKL